MNPKFLSSFILAACLQGASAQLVINEVDSDTPNTVQGGAMNDDKEFIELYDGGTGNTSLNGYVLVFYSAGSSSTAVNSYRSIDLDGATTDANGFIVIGNPTVANVSSLEALQFPPDNLQNGADAVVLYLGNASDFPNGTPASTPPSGVTLVDAVVYDTNDGDATNLLTALGETTQWNEAENSASATESVQRASDGNYFTGPPTPGATNVEPLPKLTLRLTPTTVSEGDSNPVINGEVSVDTAVSGNLTVNIDISDNTEISGPISVTILDGQAFALFELGVVNDTEADGVQSVVVTLSATGYSDASETVIVADDDINLPDIVINEMQVKSSGLEPQFVELYNFGSTSVDIAGWSVKAFGSDPSLTAEFGMELGSFTIPAGSPVTLAPGGFYLAGNATFQDIYGITPNLMVAPSFSKFDITMILFDASGNAVYTVFNTDGNSANIVNNAGATSVADITVNDGRNSVAGFYLTADGGTVAEILSFDISPAPSATPGTSNANLIPRLYVEFDKTSIQESAGTGAATATIRRVNNLTGALDVTVASSDLTEVTIQSATVQIADGESTATVLLDAVDDSDIDGVQRVTISASGAGFTGGARTLSVTDNDAPIANLVINEMLVDTQTPPTADTEMLEIYNPGTTAVDLAGYTIEKWESDSGQSGADGTPILIPSDSPIIIEPGGFYLIASPSFVTAYSGVTVDLVVPDNTFENSSQTVVLKDANGNVVFVVFNTDGGAGDQANIDGMPVTPDVVANDKAWALAADGDSANVIKISDAVPSPDVTPRASNGVASDYTVKVTAIAVASGQVTINFTATGSSDVYVSTDLKIWTPATAGSGVASGTYTDTNPPAGKAFYLIKKAGSPAP